MIEAVGPLNKSVRRFERSVVRLFIRSLTADG